MVLAFEVNLIQEAPMNVATKKKQTKFQHYCPNALNSSRIYARVTSSIIYMKLLQFDG